MEFYWAGVGHPAAVLWDVAGYARDREGGEARHHEG